MIALKGTRIAGSAPREDVDAELAALLDRGRRHARWQRLGCAVTTGGLIAGVTLMVLGHYYTMGVVGLVMLFAYVASQSLDPELEDDRRVLLVRELLAKLPIDDAAPIGLELELNDYMYEKPVEKEPLRAGKLRARYAQRWLKLGFLAASGERVTLALTVEATLEQDGIDVEEREERERAVLAFEEDGEPLEREVEPVRGWRREDDGFVVEGLASAGQVRALIESAL